MYARAILGLPIPPIQCRGASASAVILADRDSDDFAYTRLADALRISKSDHADIRIFGKPVSRPYRRMGVTLARCDNGDSNQARKLAADAAQKIVIQYDG